MKMKTILASAAVLALCACGDGSQGSEGSNTAMNDMTMDNSNAMEMNMADSNAMAADMPKTGQEYAAMAGGSDMYEIESSKLAMEKSQNKDLKDFAQMLVTDHQKSTDQLKSAAREAQPAVTVSPKMTPEQESNLQALRSANGAQFDQAYLQQQVAAHQKALAMVQGYAQNGDVPSLKQHASTVSGPIQQHLEKAQQLQSRQ
jgi:putative membrane protein